VLAQHAAIAAFDDASLAELDGHVQRYAHNRTILIDGLTRLGLTGIAPADGAFYAYADVSHLTDDSMTFAKEILDRVGVGVATGLDFDTVAGLGSLRFSFAGTTEEITEALDRLESSRMLSG
jgi:aspartate/methionine/tyrosine aminotransferase